MNEKTLM